MGVWSHTSSGIFASDVYLVSVDFGTTHEILGRALIDVLMLGATALILCWIVFDWVILGFCGCLKDCSKDDLELPVSLAAVENTSYGDRIGKTNILGSYKIENNPKYGHPIKAYKELIRRQNLEMKN